MTTTTLSALFSVNRFARLTSFSGFVVSGSDAQAFLQGQLTNDIEALEGHRHQRTGYCSPKGRLMSTLLQWKTGEASFGHLLPQESIERITKRLKMYVLRSKVIFSAPEASLSVVGLWGAPREALQAMMSASSDGMVQATLQTRAIMQEAQGADDGQAMAGSSGPWLLTETPCAVLGPRAWLIGSAVEIESLIAGLAAAELPESAWLFSEIQAGKPWVWERTNETFVPQMINFELIHGVSFTKGCYPGQEVVARSQYLGKLKRRTYRADVSDPGIVCKADPIAELPGMEIWSVKQPAEPCGTVVGAAPVYTADGQPLERLALLAETTIESWEGGDLRLGSLQGPRLLPESLPYSLAAAA